MQHNIGMPVNQGMNIISQGGMTQQQQMQQQLLQQQQQQQQQQAQQQMLHNQQQQPQQSVNLGGIQNVGGVPNPSTGIQQSNPAAEQQKLDHIGKVNKFLAEYYFMYFYFFKTS